VEAQRELAAVVDGLARRAGTGDRALLMAQLMLCQTETELRSNTAIQRCRAALAGAEAANGTDHPQLVAFLNLLGNALRVGDHAREAVDVLSRALAVAEHGAISPDELVYARAYFALALHRADPRDPRAEVAARQAAEPLGKLSGGDSLRDELVAAFPRLLRP
jgi:hypothetical protein